MSVISWIIVFVPFIFMSVIVTILLYFFGLNPATGTISNENVKEKKEKEGNLLFSV
jgi:predicted membrane protein